MLRMWSLTFRSPEMVGIGIIDVACMKVSVMSHGLAAAASAGMVLYPAKIDDWGRLN